QRLGHIPLGVGIVDPQQKLAAMLPSKQPVEQRRTEAANVQVTGWTRSETSSDSHKAEFSSQESGTSGRVKFNGILQTGFASACKSEKDLQPDFVQHQACTLNGTQPLRGLGRN